MNYLEARQSLLVKVQANIAVTTLKDLADLSTPFLEHLIIWKIINYNYIYDKENII